MKRIPGLRPAAVLFCSVLLAVQVRALDLDLQHVGGDRNIGGGDPNIGGLAFQTAAIVATEGRVYLKGQILDVTEPASPRSLGQYHGKALAVAGDHLFTIEYNLLGRWEGLQVLDVSNPATPVLVGSFRDGTSGTESGAISVSGTYAYWAEPIVGLHVLDISNPARPRQVGLYPIAARASDIVVSGKFAYVANEGIWEGTTNLVESGLLVIDISDPANPRLSGSYKARGSCYQVAATAGYAFVTETYGSVGGLTVIDVRDPSHPMRVSSFDSEYASSVAVSGNLVYLTAFGGLRVLDVTDPVEPKLVGGVHAFSEYSGDVAIVRDHIYATDSWNGFLIFRPQPANPQRLGEVRASVGGGVGHVAVSGNYGYLLESDAALQVIDCHDLANPRVVGRYTESRDATVSGNYVFLDFAVSGNYACIAADDAGLEIINIADPSSPRRVGRLDTIGLALKVAVAGNFAYVATSDRGLVAVDISDPSNPRPIGRYDAVRNAQAITVSGNYAYVADFDAGLQVIDISNPALLRRAGGYQSLGYVRGVAVSGNYAFLGEETRMDGTNAFGGGLVILDIADPSNPKRIGRYIGRYGNSFSYYSVAVAGGYAYITGSEGFEVIDISDPADLRRVGGNFVVPGTYGQLSVKGDNVFFAGNGELVIFDLFRPFRLEAIAGSNSSQRRLKVDGPRGLGVRLQRSTDIVRWEDWQAITLSSDVTEITDQDAPTTPNHFYRTVAP